MPPIIRFITTPLLAISMWFVVDGIRGITQGRFFGRPVLPSELPNHPDALVLGDGALIDYGRFGSFFAERGLDPHDLAPMFVVVGIIGIAAVIALFALRPVGYALALTASAGTLIRWGLPAGLGALLLVALLLPPVRRRYFIACADRVSAREPASPL